MARPAKSVAVLSDYSQTKAEIRARKRGEEALKSTEPPKSAEWLSERQKDIYGQIIDCLEGSDMLCLNDEYLLEQTAIAIDRLQTIEMMINKNPELITDKGLQSARTGYTRDFWRGCNELCLSPQSRAKMANIASAESKFDPLKAIIDEANDGE